MTREEQKEARRKQILLTGLDLFVTRGLAATKVSDIAKAAGMSVGLLFHYFESKEALYLKLVKMGSESSGAAIMKQGIDPLQFFEETAAGILAAIPQNPMIAKMFVFMMQAADNELLSEETRRHLKWDNIQNTKEIIIAGQKLGTIREGDPLALSVAYWSAIHGVCQMLLMDEKLPCPKGEWIVSIVRK